MSDKQFHGFESHLPSKTENQGITQASQEGWHWNRTGQNQSHSNNLSERNGVQQSQQQHGCIEFTNPYPQDAQKTNYNPRGNFYSYMGGMSDGHQSRQQLKQNQQFHQQGEHQGPVQQQQQHRPHTGAFGTYNGQMEAPKVENVTIQRGVHNALRNNWSFHSHVRPEGR